MPALRRNAAPLLKMVNNKPHATDEHHEADSLPTPPASFNTGRNGSKATAKKDLKKSKEEEDILAEPLSSEEEAEDAAPSPPPAANKGAGFRQSKQLDAAASKLPANTSKFKAPAGISPESTGSKRSASKVDADLDSDSSDAAIFSSQLSQAKKKARRAGAKPVANIQAAPAKNMYGRTKRTMVTDKSRKAGFKKAKATTEESAPRPQKPSFRIAKGADMFAFGQPEKENTSVGFQEARGGASDTPGLSDSLSELDSDVEEIDPSTLGLPTPKQYIASTDCEVCGANVPLLLKQEFEDRYMDGKQLNYRWQQRFCHYHKVAAAREAWVERGIPEIDWEGLEKRMKARHRTLIGILERRTPSVYRDRLQKLVDSGTTKSTKSAFTKAVAEDGDLEIKPGYYGPKGEKLMTEHILRHFAKELRDSAVSDPLIAAAGVAGGVSGFVQAVLVPELAVALVKEDMKVGDERARSLLAESLELGELLNEEAHERVERVESDDEGD